MSELDDFYASAFGGGDAGGSGFSLGDTADTYSGDLTGGLSSQDTGWQTNDVWGADGSSDFTYWGGGFTGEGTSDGGGSMISGAIDSALKYASGALGSISDWASKVFTEQPSTTQRFDPATREYVNVENPGGGLNSLGKSLLAGALSSLGSAAVAKWQTDRAAEEAKKNRNFTAAEKEKDRQMERDRIADQNARKPYGSDSGLGKVSTGVGLINKGAV